MTSKTVRAIQIAVVINMNDAVAYQISSVHRAHPGHGKGSAGTRPLSSNISLPPSSASSPAAASRHRPYAKRPGDARSHGHDNGDRKRCRAGKKTAPDGPKISVLCPFKIRFPGNREFVSCSAFDDFGRLREHLVDRRHKPKDQCQRCGCLFGDDLEWNQHTTLCTMRGGAFERPICVEREQVPRIRRLTSKGRQRRPIEDLYRELWIILFGKDVPLPDSIDWLIANPSRNTVEEVPRNTGIPSDLALRGPSNQSPPQAFLGFHTGYNHPAQLQRASQAIPPTMLDNSNNSYLASPTYSTSTALHSSSTETHASQLNMSGSSWLWQSDWDLLGSQYSFFEDGNGFQTGTMHVALDNLLYVDGFDLDFEAVSNNTGNLGFDAP